MSQHPSSQRPHAFMVKLVAPRPSFMHDASDMERSIMRQHSDYWSMHMDSGLVVAFGPVNHPDGAFGVGLVRARDEAEMQAFLAHDPAILAGIGMAVQTYAMPALISQDDRS